MKIPTWWVTYTVPGARRGLLVSSPDLDAAISKALERVRKWAHDPVIVQVDSWVMTDKGVETRMVFDGITKL